MFIQTEQTPNPEVLKFLPGRDVLGEGSREFKTPEEAEAAALAEALFEVEGVTRVFFGPDFVTVTKAGPDIDWSRIKAPILAAIMEHLTSGAPILKGQGEAASHDEGVYEGDTAQVVAEIKELLDTRIRPAVAQDGGDILFNRFDPQSGIVYLHMRGACSGCPSSSATLRSGVENMLKHYVPEVAAVEQAV